MKDLIRSAKYGFLAWVIPFALSILVFPLYESNLMLFKTIMIVTGALSGMMLLVKYFKKVDSGFFRAGLYTGTVWFVLNILLDLVVLVGLFKQPVGEYFIGVGLRYLIMIIMAGGLGYSLEKVRT